MQDTVMWVVIAAHLIVLVVGIAANWNTPATAAKVAALHAERNGNKS